LGRPPGNEFALLPVLATLSRGSLRLKEEKNMEKKKGKKE
jgi:hypothetical protein